MEASLEFIREGICGPIWGLIDEKGLLVRQYPADSGEKALEFFMTQSESLVRHDNVTSIKFEGKVVNL